jgi:hypothetical protein
MHPEVLNKILSLLLLVAGLALIGFAMNVSDSIRASLSLLVNGSFTNNTLWTLIGGLVAATIGGTGLFRRSKSS